jgi:hypothetical protein
MLKVSGIVISYVREIFSTIIGFACGSGVSGERPTLAAAYPPTLVTLAALAYLFNLRAYSCFDGVPSQAPCPRAATSKSNPASGVADEAVVARPLAAKATGPQETCDADPRTVPGRGMVPVLVLAGRIDS